jgi:hypothetical protein
MLETSALTVGSGELGIGKLTWRYSATPSPLGRWYDLRIEFRQGEVPELFVDAPDLVELGGGRELPHVYSQRPTRLCLYLPRAHEWRGEMRIDQTIVPWAALWLFYFEEWLVSDEWKGGGEHPRTRTSRRERMRPLRQWA